MTSRAEGRLHGKFFRAARMDRFFRGEKLLRSGQEPVEDHHHRRVVA